MTGETSGVSNQETKLGYAWYVLLLGSLAQLFVIGAAWVVMPVLFGSIMSTTGMSLKELLVVWGMIPLAVALFAIPGGLLGDRYGIRWSVGLGIVLAAGFSAFSAASLFFAVASSASLARRNSRSLAIFSVRSRAAVSISCLIAWSRFWILAKRSAAFDFVVAAIKCVPL